MGNIGAWCRIIGIVTVLAFVLKYCARATHIAGWANIYVKLFIWSDIYHISYSCIYYLSSAKSYLVLLCSFQLGKEERICVSLDSGLTGRLPPNGHKDRLNLASDDIFTFPVFPPWLICHFPIFHCKQSNEYSWTNI